MDGQLYPDDPDLRSLTENQKRLVTAQININLIRRDYREKLALSGILECEDETLRFYQNMMAESARLMLLAGEEEGVDKIKKAVEMIERKVATDDEIGALELTSAIWKVTQLKPMWCV